MASAPVSYLMYDQAEQIPLFAVFASTFKKDALIRLAAGIGNGCCRGLSMKWLQLGCSAAGMSRMGSDLAAGLGVMVEAAQLQISGQQDGADVREQLEALGMP